MKTWQDFAENEGTATTTWNYNAYRGWLDNKRYPLLTGEGQGEGTDYTYTSAGRLKSRAWARGVSTWYTNNAAGDLVTINYSDSTPDVTYTYDRLGRQKTIAAGGMTTTRAYNDANQLLRESHAGGPLNGIGITNVYDYLLRRTNVATVGSTTAYGYDSASRLETVTNGVARVTYSYLTDSPLVGQITFATNGTTVMTTTKGYDALNRLTNIVSSGAGFQPVSFAYQYNTANQRTAITNTDESRWVYQYDSLGQVLSGKKYWSDGTAVAGQHFEYAFDDIGNRQSTKAGGDNSGASLRPASYLNNSLNQILSREVLSYVNVLGTASNNATVTLWGDNGQYSPTTRKGEYFRGELYANNSTGAVWLTITNVAVLNNGANPDIVTNTTGKVLLSKTPEVFTHDTDGNLTSDGLWTNVWNGENRLIEMESIASVPTGAKKKLVFGYDAQGRRISKTVSNWVSGNWQLESDRRFVYDGWNLVAVLNSALSLQQSFQWGSDLIGTMQSAGGVGGLLAVNDVANGVHFAAYDGNGNVMALVKGSDGTVSANYEYGPFGELIRATGLMARVNPLRFSTKFQDDETDFLYYGYRSYNPVVGRWLSRDPVAEKGGVNVYGFVGNSPLIRIDPFGLDYGWPVVPPPGYPPTLPAPGPQPPRTVPTNAPAIDCSGYANYKGSSCVSCGGWGSKTKDTYPEKAQKVCEGFSKIYTGASNQSNAACVATCLIDAEDLIQAFSNCSDRNCFRLLAHIKCYKDCGFWPDKGLPPGGSSVGALDLLPSATLSRYCQRLVIPPQHWGIW